MKKNPKPRRVVLGEGYLSYHVSGRSVALVVNEGGSFCPMPISLNKPSRASDHNRVRLVAELL